MMPTITIYMKNELYEKVAAAAKDNGLQVSQEIVKILEERVE
jgi:hypothetical protein